MYDALVVGAGPAGSATAAHLAARGHRVLLVDRARFPRRKPCAEYISPGGVALLERLGVVERLHAGRRLRGMRITAPNGACHLIDYRDPRGQAALGLSIARTDLDATLVDVARSQGAEVREGVRIVAPLVRHGVVCGGVDASGQEMLARIVIGADGLHSVIARASGRPRHQIWPRRLGLVLHIKGVDWPEDTGQMHVGRRGYVGVAPLDGQGTVTVGLVRPLEPHVAASAADRVRASLSEHPELERRLAHGTPAGAVQGVGPLARTVRRVAGPGYLLVGDAAGFFDPFTGEGIFRALRGADLAVAAAESAVRGADLEAVAACYTRARADAFRAKEQLTSIVQVFVQVPALMNLAVARLQARQRVAQRLGNMLGDLEPARLGVVGDLLTLMRTSIARRAHADARVVYEFAAAVEDWPRILPHYRWVRVLETLPDGRRRVEMAARRDVFPVSRIGIPVRWTAIQTLYPDEPRVDFEHVRGVTRGMQVSWIFEPLPGGDLNVEIRHAFDPRWPVPDALVHLIIGEYFVNGVAYRTLRRICDLAEARTRAVQR